MKGISIMLPPLLMLLAFLLLWQALVVLLQPGDYVLPAPSAVLAASLDQPVLLLRALAQTTLSAVIGFAIAAALGIALGSLISFSPFLRRGLYPLATLLQMVPIVAIAPVLVIWCGYGRPTVVASAAIVALFPVLANTLEGIRSCDPKLHELFTVCGARRFTRWWRLELPAALPQIVTGLRIAAGLAVIGAVVGEFIGAFVSDPPIGTVIQSAMREGRTALVLAAVAASSVAGFALFGLVSATGHLLLRRWHPSAH
ncbi:MAG: ABC transporter permease [Planctomycetes bacterium]|nr:ABC transporter permease [Planctomycetota bacterium]